MPVAQAEYRMLKMWKRGDGTMNTKNETQITILKNHVDKLLDGVQKIAKERDRLRKALEEIGTLCVRQIEEDANSPVGRILHVAEKALAELEGKA